LRLRLALGMVAPARRRLMKVLILGATGMVGQGVLRECLAAPDVEKVVTLGRRPTGLQATKLVDLVSRELDQLPDVLRPEVDGLDACFYCLGVSSAGMEEPTYRHLTFDLTLGLARPLSQRNPRVTFVYVSGAATGLGSPLMWARVKGETEAALQALPFKAAYALRPGVIAPAHGERSGVFSYRAFYTVAAPVLAALRVLSPGLLLTTETVGRAMLRLGREGWPTPVLEKADILKAGA
jgi:uncharacterized protein YbjT (DUF2867 family)